MREVCSLLLLLICAKAQFLEGKVRPDIKPRRTKSAN